jgi:hypothetical protein
MILWCHSNVQEIPMVSSTAYSIASPHTYGTSSTRPPAFAGAGRQVFLSSLTTTNRGGVAVSAGGPDMIQGLSRLALE